MPIAPWGGRRPASSPSTRRPRSSEMGEATGRRRVGRLPLRGLLASDFPAVGDWVALQPETARPMDGAAPSSPRSSRGGARSDDPPATCLRGAGAAGSPTSRSSPPTSTRAARRRPRPRPQPAPDRALPRGRLVERGHAGRRPQQGGRGDRPRGPARSPVSRPSPPASRSIARQRPDAATASAASLAHLRGRSDGRRPRARRASASRRSSTRCWAWNARRRRPSARTTRAAATRRRTASCSRCPAARCSSTRPGSAPSRSPGRDEGLASAFDDIEALAADCRFSDCRHDGEPGCAVRTALADGRLTRDRLESHRKLERELAHEARRADPRAAAQNRRRWKAISKSVSKHIERKYGGDPR